MGSIPTPRTMDKLKKGQPAPKPFEGYTVYGPYLHINEGRRYVALVRPGHRTSMSYARYVVSVSLQIEIGTAYEVDHIDNDKLNDDITNLQILPWKENKLKNMVLGRYMVVVICEYCGKEVWKERRQVHSTTRFCSRPCLWASMRKS